MGDVLRTLHSSKLARPAPVYYADKRSIELAETLHHHERNLRLEYDGSPFANMLVAFMRAREAWMGRGCPRDSFQTEYLSLTDIEPEPSVTPRRFDVEECTYPTLPETTIHIHLRNLRIELSHEEWVEISDGIIAARAEFDRTRD